MLFRKVNISNSFYFFFLTRFFLSFSGDTLVPTCLFLNCCHVKTRTFSSTKTGGSISHGNMKYIFIFDFVMIIVIKVIIIIFKIY